MTTKFSDDTEARRVRAALDHPIIDADGHILESLPLLMQYVERLYGSSAVGAFRAENAKHPVRSMGNRDRNEPRSAWWGTTNNALDQATCTAPALFADRMGELGLDFAILYPSFGLRVLTIRDDTVRRQMVRAENTLLAEITRDHADKLTPVGVIPMHTPDEAVEELHHAVGTLGLKTVTMPPGIARPLPALPDVFPLARRLDRYGIDSDYDYTPVWQTCVDLGVAVTFHGGQGFFYMPDGQESPSNFAANHIMAHATLQLQSLKSLLFAGVPRRFPTLKIAFQEGGVGWAVDLIHHFEEHYEKRNVDGLKLLDPRGLDQGLYSRLLEEYGIPSPQTSSDGLVWRSGSLQMNPADAELPTDADWVRDEFADSLIEDEEDIKEIFEKQLFFGCESDDTSVYRAIDTKGNAMNTRLQSLFSSDAGHFDLADLRTAVPASRELVDDGLLSEDDYREFVFENVVRLHGGMNPRFFDGTAVEKEARAFLDKSAASTSVGV